MTSSRVLRSEFTERWDTDLEGLAAALHVEGPRYDAAWAAGDAVNATAVVGEVRT
jgi:nitronate monooxygenase